MTNEEMMRLYLAGDEDIIADIYSNVEGFIKSIASHILDKYNLTEFDLRDELYAQGGLAFVEVLNKKEYDETKGKLTTYLHPHIEGYMIRFVKRYLTYKTHVSFVCEFDNKKDDEDGKWLSVYDYSEDAETVPPHIAVYKKICAELLHEIFDTLSRKDKIIIGKSFGVFGYRKTRLDDIALEQIMKVDGVIKARDKALEKLRQKYEGSNLQIWQTVYKAIMREAERVSGD